MNHETYGVLHGNQQVDSCTYYMVNPRFSTRDEWLDYLRRLPRQRPDDSWVRFTVDGTSTTVTEGSYVSAGSWHLFVGRVSGFSVPGELLQLGIARVHPALSAETLVASAHLVASNQLEF